MRYLILVLIFFSTFIFADTNRRIKTTYLDFLEPEGANDYKCTVQQGTQAGSITLTLPITSDTLVGLATSDTLLNKTLTSPAINGGNITQVSTLSTGGQTPLKLYETDNTNYLGIKAPSSVTSDVEFTLPDGDGENGQTLLTDGSGQLSWGASGDSSFKLQNFTTTTVTIKAGQMIINGLEYVTYDGAGTAETDFATDLVYTPSGLGVSQKYYLYIDTSAKSELTLDSGRVVQAIENDDFFISTSTPYGNDIDTTRYIALGLITTNGSSEIDAIYNVAFRYQDSWKQINLVKSYYFTDDEKTTTPSASASNAVSVTDSNASGSTEVGIECTTAQCWSIGHSYAGTYTVTITHNLNVPINSQRINLQLWNISANYFAEFSNLYNHDGTNELGFRVLGITTNDFIIEFRRYRVGTSDWSAFRWRAVVDVIQDDVISVATNSYRERITTKNTSGTDSKHQITLPSFMTDKTYAVNLTYHDDSASRDFDILGAVYDKAQDGYLTLNLDSITFASGDYIDVVASYGAKAVGLPIDNETIVQDSGRIKVDKALDTDHLLNATDFPDATSLYGWNVFASSYADSDTISGWVGSKILTVDDSGASGINAITDHLGGLNALALDGTDDFLYTSDSTFDTANEDFTFHIWAKPDDFSASRTLAGKWENSGGHDSWRVRLTTTEIYFAYSYNGTNAVALQGVPIDILADLEWHHIAVVYDYIDADTSILMTVVDGRIVGYKKVTTATNGSRFNDSSSDLMIGAQSNGGAEGWFKGSIADWAYKKEALTPNEIRKIYSAGSRKFVTQDGNSKVAILDGSKNNGYYYVPLTSSFSVTSGSFQIVSDQTIYIPESGLYKITAFGSAQAQDADSTDNVIYFQLANAGTQINNSNCRIRLVASTNGEAVSVPYFIESIVYLEKDNAISLEVRDDSAGDESFIFYSSGSSEPYIMWEKLD